MTATNHALTGAIIGLIVGQPVVAIPLAIASHFICDAIPHYSAGKSSIAGQNFKRLLAIDATGCLAIVSLLAIYQPTHWLLAAGCAFLAASPDFMWIKKFYRAQHGSEEPKQSPWVLRFHAAIQWFERPIGATVELAWAVTGAILLKVFIV